MRTITLVFLLTLVLTGVVSALQVVEEGDAVASQSKSFVEKYNKAEPTPKPTPGTLVTVRKWCGDFTCNDCATIVRATNVCIPNSDGSVVLECSEEYLIHHTYATKDCTGSETVSKAPLGKCLLSGVGSYQDLCRKAE